MNIPRPLPGEYSESHTDYIAHVPKNIDHNGDIMGFLSTQLDAYLHTLARIAEAQAAVPWQEGKWSLKQELGHLIDGERILAYRALALSRGKQQPLPGFEQDDYVREGNFHQRTLADLTREFELQRRANLLQFAHLCRSRPRAKALPAVILFLSAHCFTSMPDTPSAT